MVFVLPRDAISRFVKGVVPLVWQHSDDVGVLLVRFLLLCDAGGTSFPCDFGPLSACCACQSLSMRNRPNSYLENL